MSEGFPELEELKRRLGLIESSGVEETKDTPPPPVTDQSIEQDETLATGPETPVSTPHTEARESIARQRRARSMLRVSIRDVIRTAEDYRRQSLLDAMLLSSINIQDILGSGGGQPIFAGQEFYADDLLETPGLSVGDLRAVINHVTWVSDGKSRAMMIVVSFVYKNKILDETVITAKNSDEAKTTLKILLQRLAQKIKSVEGGGTR